MSTSSVRDVIIDTVTEVARYRQPLLPRAGSEQTLSGDLGLESLDLAQLVAELELRLGVDPFAQGATARIVTVGELISVYEKACVKSG